FPEDRGSVPGQDVGRPRSACNQDQGFDPRHQLNRPRNPKHRRQLGRQTRSAPSPACGGGLGRGFSCAYESSCMAPPPPPPPTRGGGGGGIVPAWGSRVAT